MKNQFVWTQQDDRNLKFLKEQKCLTDWNQISQILNLNSKNSSMRSAKECRQRYNNYARFDLETLESKQWNEQQDNMLLNLYMKQGCKWTHFTYHFPNRSQNSIKNRFYSCLRKAARMLSEKQRFYSHPQKNQIGYQMIMNIFDMANEIEVLQPQVCQRIENSLQIISLKKQLFLYVFKSEEFEDMKTVELVKKIRKLNSKIRSFGIFKLKTRKNWKLSPSGIEKLLMIKSSSDAKIKIEDQ